MLDEFPLHKPFCARERLESDGGIGYVIMDLHRAQLCSMLIRYNFPVFPERFTVFDNRNKMYRTLAELSTTIERSVVINLASLYNRD
jgi:hypothetical protein